MPEADILQPATTLLEFEKFTLPPLVDALVTQGFRRSIVSKVFHDTFILPVLNIVEPLIT